MGDVVNLNGFRRRKERQGAERKAAENRAKFGRTGAEKALLRTEVERDKKDLDGKRLDDGGTPS